MQSEKINITIFIGITTTLMLLMGLIIVLVIYLYQQKKLIHIHLMNELSMHHEKVLTSTQLEIQENLFRHISQEIHDNVGLTLSLVKLRLNTLDFSKSHLIQDQVYSSVDLLSESIEQLRNISRSLNADLINSYGLIKALENEVYRITQLSGIDIELLIEGEPIYMDSQKELIIFRIIQESCNNILKHAEANSAVIKLHYSPLELTISIKDQGKGFNMSEIENGAYLRGSGIKNMSTRSKMIRAIMEVSSAPSEGTTLKFIIPI